MADIYKPHVSGITNYIALHKQHLEKAGHEAYVFAFGDLEFRDDEPNVIRSPGLPVPDTGYYLSFRYSRPAKALLQTMELVHVHHPFLSGRLALRYCRPLRIPIVFTNHTRYDLYAQAYLPLLPEEISDTLLQTYLPHFCAAVDLVISPSPGMADVLRRLGVTAPIEIVPNGVRLDAFHQAGRGLRAELGFQESDILSIYVGRLEREKSLEFLLRAFCGVAEAVENAHLLIVGSGTEEAVLKEQAAASLAADRIHFAGMLVYDLLPAYLAMCDLFVTASVTEVHPLSVIEAMASGLPVLGIQSVGVGDTVEDGTTGFLSSNSEAAFAARLARLCLDPDLRSRMGTAAREAAKKYDVERTTEIVLSHYRRLISAATSPKRGLRVRLRGLLERMRG